MTYNQSTASIGNHHGMASSRLNSQSNLGLQPSTKFDPP